MARILIGWELGGGAGHAVKIRALATILEARGHAVVIAAQSIATIPAEWPVWQAPLWPAQLTTRARRATRGPATMGDILAVMGLGDAEAMRALIAAWDALLVAIRPDVVAAEYAPGLMMAAQGRIPLLALGTGFSLPPAHLAHFSSLTGEPPIYPEAPLIDAVNRALIACGRARIDRLPAIFNADRTQIPCFVETDPYRTLRTDADYAAPSISAGITPASGDGEELFVYVSGGIARWGDALWQALAGSGLPVRIHDPHLDDDRIALLERAGLTIERRPVPFARIIERSRMILSHGGLGIASSALVAGLPHIMVPHDLEKQFTAAAVRDMGLGLSIDGAKVTADGLTVAFGDTALAGRSLSAAAGFAARVKRSAEEDAALLLEGMVNKVNQ